MKTQIINIEPHDDAISVKDKMEWGHSVRILIVWPGRDKILQRELELIQIKRHSIALGSQLALVAENPTIRKYAKSLNIPVYPNIRKAEMSHWRSYRRNGILTTSRKNTNPRASNSKPNGSKTQHLEALRKLAYPDHVTWLEHPIIRLVFFSLGVLGVLAVAAILVPGAEINITPQTEWINIPLNITADPNITDVKLTGSVPINTISVVVEGRGQTQSTGSILIPDTKARGNVVFTNLTNKEVTIPEGTIISTEGETVVRYSTQEATVVPSYSESESISVEAINPGSIGNQRPNKIVAIEGPLGLDLTVINPFLTSRGSDREVPAPVEKDFQKLKTDLVITLFEAALLEIEDLLNEDDIILKFETTDYKIIIEEYSPSNNLPGDNLFLTLQTEFFASIVSAEDLYVIGTSILEANLPEGYEPFPSTIEIIHNNLPERKSGGNYEWDLEVKWKVGAIIDYREVPNLVLWNEPQQAQTKLMDNLPIEPKVSIKNTPGWWPRLPILPFRVTVNNTD